MATRSPTLAAVEAEVPSSGADDPDWFDVLSRYEPVRAHADRLSEQDKRIVAAKFWVLRAFEKHIQAEFRLEDIAGYLITPDGDVRSRMSLPTLKALLRLAVRQGRLKGAFETLDRPTHRVDSACYELRPKAMKDDEVDDVEMALRKLFTIVDGRTAEVQDIERALVKLYELRSQGLLVEGAPPSEPPAPARPAPKEPATFPVACPNPACGARLRVPVAHAGKRGRCPRCGNVFDLPAQSD